MFHNVHVKVNSKIDDNILECSINQIWKNQMIWKTSLIWYMKICLIISFYNNNFAKRCHINPTKKVHVSALHGTRLSLNWNMLTVLLFIYIKITLKSFQFSSNITLITKATPSIRFINVATSNMQFVNY